MPYTSPSHTWASGETVTAANLNSFLRDNTDFLYSPPRCRVTRNSDFTHNSSSNSLIISFDAERFDTDTMHSNVSSNSRITFTTAGTYLVIGNIAFDYNTTGSRGLQIMVNGATEIAGDLRGAVQSTGQATRIHVSTIYQFIAGDYVELRCYQDSGGNLSVKQAGQTNISPEFMAAFLGSP